MIDDEKFDQLNMIDHPADLDALRTALWIEGPEALDRAFRALLDHVRELRAEGLGDDEIEKNIVISFSVAKVDRTVWEARIVRFMIWQALDQLREEG